MKVKRVVATAAAALVASAGIVGLSAAPAQAGTCAVKGIICGRVQVRPASSTGVTIYDGWTFYNSTAGKPVGTGRYLGPGQKSNTIYKDTDGFCIPVGYKFTGQQFRNGNFYDNISWTGCHKVGDNERIYGGTVKR